MMNFQEATQHRARLELLVNEASQRLRTYPKGALGLTPDHVKQSIEWKLDKALFDTRFAKLKAFNRLYVKQFARELKAQRNQRFETVI